MSPGIPVSLNPSVRGLGNSATLAINERSAALVRAGRTVYRFGLGQSPFPVPESVVAALRDAAAEKDYLPVQGLQTLREAVAAYHRRVDQVDILPSGVLIGPGSKELLFLAQLAFDGDLVVPAPCWVSYAPQAGIVGKPVRVIPTDFQSRWRVTPKQLEALCAEEPGRSRLLILNYPGNPDGCTYTGEELEALAAVCRRHKLVVISDEIYGPLHFEGQHVSLARYYPEGTIISGGLSKWCGAGGWRLGTFAFPAGLEWLQRAMAAVASETFTSVSAPIQHAAITAFKGSPTIDLYIEDSRRVLSAIASWTTERLRRAGVNVHRPVGGFYMTLDFSELDSQLRARGVNTNLVLAERLLDEAGVAILGGACFQLPEQWLTARLAFVDFDGGSALLAARTEPVDEIFFRRYCPRIVAGVEALCDWLPASPHS